MTRTTKTTKTTKAPTPEEDKITVAELQGKIWGLEGTIDNVIKNYKKFYCDMTWAHYGEIIMLKDSISDLRKHLGTLSDKLEKGEKA